MRSLTVIALVPLTISEFTVSSFGFVCSHQPSRTGYSSGCSQRIRALKQSLSNNDNDDSPKQQQQQQDPVEAFMEEASRKGADKVKAMSIEERTRRAMLAEAVEDRIFSMYDDLEGLLQNGVPVSEEDRDEIKNLAKEIKASQSHYENLVSGERSAMLGAINDIGATGETKNRKSDDMNDQDNK